MFRNNDFTQIFLNTGNIDRYYHRKSILKSIEDNLAYFQGKLLDAGCGKMPYKSFLFEKSTITEYIGLDIEGALVYDEGVQPDYHWDGKSMPFDNDTFETVFATEVLEHVPHPELYLAEVFRVLKGGGNFFFTTPFLWPLHESPHDEYRYTPYAMKRLLEDTGFQKIEINALGGWNASMAQMLGLWLKRSSMSKLKRNILTRLLYPAYKYLLKKDKNVIHDGVMLTGIYGKATKPVQ